MAEIIIIISGSSGAGKDSVLQGLVSQNKKLSEVSTYTTRSKRTDEKEGKGHFYVSEKKFAQLFEAGEILEKNFYAGAWYGVPKSAILKIQKNRQLPILEIDVNGFKQIKKKYPNTISIYIDCAEKEAKIRLINRGENSAQDIAKRLEMKKIEDRQKGNFDLVVKNQQGKLDQTIQEVLNFIKKSI